MRMLSKSLPVARRLGAAACVVSAQGHTVLRVTGVAGLAVLMANCSQAPQGGRLSSQESREIGFFSHRKFGPASPRVVADGQAVPKGGGRDHVGRSYTIAGKRYTPYVKPVGYVITGSASWYGPAFHGRKTANGEVYDRHGVSAAHPTMPLPSYARVTNLGNRRSIIVRVNDRGPYHGGRVIDLSQKTAELLDFRHLGTARVKVEYVGRASLQGSDDRMLVASLTTDGSPAGVPGLSQPGTMVANAPPLTSPRLLPATGVVERPVAETVAVAQAPVQRAVAEPATFQTAAAPQPVRVVSDAPRPPERPYDLSTIPGAGTPITFAGAAPGATRAAAARPVVASLYFAKPEPVEQRFDPKHPLVRDLKPQRFVALR
jgi:rare lipoprotein A